MKTFILFFISLVAISNAQDLSTKPSETFLYKGQAQESINLLWHKEGTLYRTEYRNATCTRQVPYEVYECNDVTRYRTECNTIPGRNNCRTVYDNVCRNVQRQRQECSNGPSRRVCSTTPARRSCHTRPARERCRMVNGERRCTTIPSAETCNTIPSRETCRNVAGARSCRMVSYTDRECDRVSRQQCDWIPERRVCDDIPYQEEVCGDVTHYRSEDYACQEPYQVPYEAIIAKYNTNTKIQFMGASDQDIEFKITLDDSGKSVISLFNEAPNTDLVFVKTKTEDINQTTEIEVDREQTYVLDLKRRDDFIESTKNSFSKISLRKSSNTLGFTIDKKINLNSFQLQFTVLRRSKVIVSKLLDANDSRLNMTEINGSQGVIVKLSDFINSNIRRVKYSVKLVLIPKKVGDILNTSELPSLETKKSVVVKALK